MNMPLKQAKDIFIFFFGIAGIILVLFPLFIMIILKKGLLQSWRGLVARIKKHEAQSLFSCSLSTGANKIAKEETDTRENKQDTMSGGFF